MQTEPKLYINKPYYPSTFRGSHHPDGCLKYSDAVYVYKGEHHNLLGGN